MQVGVVVRAAQLHRKGQVGQAGQLVDQQVEVVLAHAAQLGSFVGEGERREAPELAQAHLR